MITIHALILTWAKDITISVSGVAQVTMVDGKNLFDFHHRAVQKDCVDRFKLNYIFIKLYKLDLDRNLNKHGYIKASL